MNTKCPLGYNQHTSNGSAPYVCMEQCRSEIKQAVENTAAHTRLLAKAHEDCPKDAEKILLRTSLLKEANSESRRFIQVIGCAACGREVEVIAAPYVCPNN